MFFATTSGPCTESALPFLNLLDILTVDNVYCYSLADRASRQDPDNVSSGKSERNHKNSQHFLSYFTYTAMAYGSYNSRGIMGHDPHITTSML